jgi:hypothetical protein
MEARSTKCQSGNLFTFFEIFSKFKCDVHGYVHSTHRKLRTRRRMHLCMQDDQIGQKTGLAPADMARLPHLINTKIVFSSKQPTPSAGTTPTLKLPWFTREIVRYWLDILLLELRLLWKHPVDIVVLWLPLSCCVFYRMIRPDFSGWSVPTFQDDPSRLFRMIRPDFLRLLKLNAIRWEFKRV